MDTIRQNNIYYINNYLYKIIPCESLKYSTIIENQSYDKAMFIAMEQKIPVNEESQFSNIYANEIARIINSINIESSAFSPDLRAAILNDITILNKVTTMNCSELFPSRMKSYIDEIDFRRQQKVQLKTTKHKQCRRCNGRQITFEEQQMRCADEAATNKYMCLTCKHKWQE